MSGRDRPVRLLILKRPKPRGPIAGDPNPKNSIQRYASRGEAGGPTTGSNSERREASKRNSHSSLGDRSPPYAWAKPGTGTMGWMSEGPITSSSGPSFKSEAIISSQVICWPV